ACSHIGSTLYALAASQTNCRYPAGYTSCNVDVVLGRRFANSIERLYWPARYAMVAGAGPVRGPFEERIHNAASSHNRRYTSSAKASAVESISLRRGCRSAATAGSKLGKTESPPARQTPLDLWIGSCPSFSAARCP